MEAPPPPSHILRGHLDSVTCLSISDDNERIYSGDSGGRVICTSTRTLRPILSWQAHDDALLGVQECHNEIITHGRDHKMHIWRRAKETQRIGESAALRPGNLKPALERSMDVNALNYCRFSLLQTERMTDGDDAYLIALPNLVESSEVDIWSFPSSRRLHAAIGKEKNSVPTLSEDGRGNASHGIAMSLHLYTHENALRMLVAYEDGTVVLRSSQQVKSVEGLGWDILWSSKLHVESVMAMTVTQDNAFAYTVSADHLVGRYELETGASEKYRIKQPGNGCVAVRDDGRVCAIGGWDGRVRLYSTKSFKPLGTLKYHKSSCQAVIFAHSQDDTSDEDEEVDVEERARWLVSASKDKLVSIWTLKSFEKM
ncbi:WD-40 repeat-containing protein [Cylindrobasidium torrendii FP15055 ss-10]|uniref:ASTRA-associated protein 1 n=1 Tax=Cylindrobasidium torrendii FP15055 ss-10 TaxID=1314674 RepID=A0A0D7BCV4_9AGAR|nr:WD-40 repeat-containing protein [Cylindrobasidium torrendii FP15055 ss-10]